VLLDLCAGRDDWRNAKHRLRSDEDLPQLPGQRQCKRATRKAARLSCSHRLNQLSCSTDFVLPIIIGRTKSVVDCGI